MSDKQLTVIENDRLRELESEIRSGLQTFREVGSALLQIRDEKLYRATHESFEDYCDRMWDMGKTRAYQLIGSAEVMRNLTVTKVIDLPTNESQVRPLIDLPADKQSEAWSQAVDEAPGGVPSQTLVQKIVDALLGQKQRHSSRGKTKTSWTKEEVKADQELMDALLTIAAAYGNEDAKAIREGSIGYTKKDILLLSKQTPEKLKELHDLIFETRWTPEKALKFLKKMPDDSTTIGELKNYALANKGKCFQGDFDGFHMIFTLKRAARR